MQVENDYDKDVYNGDLGVVSDIDVEEGELAFDFATCPGGPQDLEEILRALYESEINVSISWVRDNGIDVEYDASDKVSTFSEATAWLRDQACKHYPDSEFARKYGGFV
jgi:hypothetical protein